MNTTLIKFRHHCQRCQRASLCYDYRGRANVFGQLIDRHGRDAVLRHKRWIRHVLDNCEGLCVVE